MPSPRSLLAAKRAISWVSVALIAEVTLISQNCSMDVEGTSCRKQEPPDLGGRSLVEAWFPVEKTCDCIICVTRGRFFLTFPYWHQRWQELHSFGITWWWHQRWPFRFWNHWTVPFWFTKWVNYLLNLLFLHRTKSGSFILSHTHIHELNIRANLCIIVQFIA